jgi:hypothetical protein
MYTAKVAVCSEIRTKHITQSEHCIELLNVKTWWYVKKILCVKRLMRAVTHLTAREAGSISYPSSV